MRRVLVGSLGGVVAGVFVALVVLNALGVSFPASTPHSLGSSVGVKLVIKVRHADGSVQTYVKNGDLALLNFARLLVKLTRGQNDPDGDDDIPLTGGSTWTDFGYIGNQVAQIWLGNVTNPSVNLNNYTFNAPIKFSVQDADISVNGTDITVDVFGSYTVDTAFNVTVVGLVVNCDTAAASYSKWVMIFCDVLPTPIHLNAGDGITVHYYIYINNP